MRGRLRRWSVSFNDPHKTALSLLLVSLAAQTPPPNRHLSYFLSPSSPNPFSIPSSISSFRPCRGGSGRPHSPYLSGSQCPRCRASFLMISGVISFTWQQHTHVWYLFNSLIQSCASSSLGQWNWGDSPSDCHIKLNYLSLKLRSSLKQPMGLLTEKLSTTFLSILETV